MFKNFLASIGIGKAKVDTILLTERLTPGEPFVIEVVIKGGDVEQYLNGIELAVMATAKGEIEVDDEEVEVNKSLVLQHWAQALDLTIAANQVITRQFTLTLHPEMPVTTIGSAGRSKVWLQTGLDIKSGIDGSDKDMLAIEPTATQLAVLRSVENSGFNLFKVDIESGQVSGHGFHSQLPCYQEFEFKPSASSLFGINELEVTFVNDGNHTGVLLEVDRAFRGDGYKSVVIPNDNVSEQAIAPYISQLLG